MSNEKKVKQRNIFHNHPLLFKGGVHEKTNKQKRKGAKQKWKKEWCSLIVVTTVIKERHSIFPLPKGQDALSDLFCPDNTLIV